MTFPVWAVAFSAISGVVVWELVEVLTEY